MLVSLFACVTVDPSHITNHRDASHDAHCSLFEARNGSTGLTQPSSRDGRSLSAQYVTLVPAVLSTNWERGSNELVHVSEMGATGRQLKQADQ